MVGIGEFRDRLHELAAAGAPVLFYVVVDGSLANAYDFEVCMRCLSLKDQQKVLDRRSSMDRHLKLVNKLILPVVLTLYRGSRHLVEPKFRYSDLGKPSAEGVSFNISDEKDTVSVVVDFQGNSELGLDLANVQDIARFNTEHNGFLADFKDIFVAEEMQYLATVSRDTQDVVLAHYWALKESYSKFLGVGLNESFQAFNFSDTFRDASAGAPTPDRAVITDGAYRVCGLQWQQHPLDANSRNYIARLTPDLVCSIFSSNSSMPVSAEPAVIELSLEFFISLVKSLI